MDAIEKVRMEIGPFTAWVAGNPKKFVVATFALGFAAGALIF